MAECPVGRAVFSRIYIPVSGFGPDHGFAGEHFILFHADLAGGGGAFFAAQ